MSNHVSSNPGHTPSRENPSEALLKQSPISENLQKQVDSCAKEIQEKYTDPDEQANQLGKFQMELKSAMQDEDLAEVEVEDLLSRWKVVLSAETVAKKDETVAKKDETVAKKDETVVQEIKEGVQKSERVGKTAETVDKESAALAKHFKLSTDLTNQLSSLTG